MSQIFSLGRGSQETAGGRAARSWRDPLRRSCSLVTVVTVAVLASPAIARQGSGVSDDVRALQREHDRAARRVRRLFDDFAAPRARKSRERTLERWAIARDEALRAIFDLSVYPDEDHGRVGQPIVDEKVEVVRAEWPTVEAFVRRDLAAVMALEPAEAAALLEETTAVVTRCATLTAEGASLEVTPIDPAWLVLLATRAGAGATATASAELGAWERHLVQRLRDERVLRDNVAALRAASAGVAPTREEWEQVRITNDYRAMMGRPALALDGRLVQSARGHAEDMLRLDFFDHDSPVKGKESFSQRIAAAGYPAPAGENIAMGMGTPQAAHEGWYRSSGHHRSILSEGYTAMGSGKAGSFWVQNFGS